MDGWWLVSYIALWTLLLLLGVLGLAILRQLGLIYIRLGGAVGARQTSDGPILGGTVPLPDRYREVAAESNVLLPRSGRIGVLLFLTPTCSICDEIIPHLPAYARSLRRAAEVVVVLSDHDHRGRFDGWDNVRPRLLVDAELHTIFDIPTYPYGVAVDETGVVRSKGTVNTVPQLDSLLDEALLVDEAPPQEPAVKRLSISQVTDQKG